MEDPMPSKLFTDDEYREIGVMKAQGKTWQEVADEIGYKKKGSSLGTLYKTWQRQQDSDDNPWTAAIQNPLEKRIKDLENQIKKVRQDMKLVEKLEKLEFEVSEISKSLQISPNLPDPASLNGKPDDGHTQEVLDATKDESGDALKKAFDDEMGKQNQDDEVDVDENLINKVKTMIDQGIDEDEIAETLGIHADVVYDVDGGVFDDMIDEDDHDFAGDDI